VTERDGSAVLLVVTVLLAAVALAAAAAWRWRRGVPEVEPEAEPEVDDVCAVCGSAASSPWPVVEREDGLADYVRRSLGGPARYQVADGPGALELCAPHAALAGQLLRVELSSVERDRHAALLAVEARLAAFERGGLARRMEELTR